MMTELLNLPLALVSGNESVELDGFFANYAPVPGATLIDQEFATYPFANQAVAANATIAQPLQISMRMVCPVRNTLGYAQKLATMLLLKMSLDKHNQTGGTYTVITTCGFYTNLLMRAMRDVSGGESAQAQHTWQMDFLQPRLTLEDAQAAQNSLMSKLTGGDQVTDPSWSGTQTLAGQTSPAAAGTAAYQPGTVGSVTAAPLPPVPGIPLQGYNTVPPMGTL